VPSYHKYKYFIVFFDDYTSFAWIILLWDKASAITALKQWLVLIKNQFNATIKEWMSDASGEYKLGAFIKHLKDAALQCYSQRHIHHSKMGMLSALCAQSWIKHRQCA